MIIEQVKKDFSAGCFQNAFIKVSYNMSLEGDAKKALGVLTDAHFESVRSDIRTEIKTTIRKLMKEWETKIDTFINVSTLSP